MTGYRTWLERAKQIYFTATGDVPPDDHDLWFDYYCDNYTPMEAIERLIMKPS